MSLNSSLVLATLLFSGCGAIMEMTMAVAQAATVPEPTATSTSTPPSAAVFSVATADTQGFIHDWLVLDPIELTDGTDQSEEVIKPMLTKEYFKDQLKVEPKDTEKVRVGPKELRWRRVKLDAATTQIDLVQFAASAANATESVLFWGLTHVIADEEMKDVKLAIGSDDSSKWWVNGEEVIAVYESRPCTADDSMSKAITLKKGVNEVRFAVINGGGEAGACARFLDSKNKPVTKLAISAIAPAK